MERSRSFDYGRRDSRPRDGYHRQFHEYVPDVPARSAPPKFERLNIDVVPTSTPEQQRAFQAENAIRLLGTAIPPPVLSFTELNLGPDITAAIATNQWETPTPIQSISIPVALKGRDLIGIAKTGSGKTAAFVIPALIHIQRQEPMQRGDGPIVLVLSPTRELAQQTSHVTNEFAGSVGIRQCCVFGGASRSVQAMELRRSPSFVVACPGRMIDFIKSGNVNMNRISFLVLDEADRMLDMGFEEQIRNIIGRISTDRQTLMFSATWPKDVRQLANDFLVNPVHMIIGSNELTTNSSIKQTVEKVEEYEKLAKCVAFLEGHADDKAIIFTKTKRSCDDLADNLTSKGLLAYALHGDKTQAARDAVLNRFKKSKNGILVATDVASRGLDVTDVDMVVNFDFPGDIDSYIHRIGRTARGTKTGLALSYFTNENRNLSRKLVKVMRQAQQEIPDWLLKLADTTPRGASRQSGYGRGFGRAGGGGGGDRFSGGGGRHGFDRPYGGGGGRGYGYGGPPAYGGDSGGYGFPSGYNPYGAPATYPPPPPYSSRY
jgi:superfamily II DNA/RNA helicase